MLRRLITWGWLAALTSCAVSATAPATTHAPAAAPIPGIAGYLAEDNVFSHGDRQARHRFAVVEVRPEGVERSPLDGSVATVVHIAVELRNLGEQPLTLDPGSLALDVALTDERDYHHLTPARIVGSTNAAPHSDTTADLFFVLPAKVSPKWVAGLRLTWMAQAGSHAYLTSTPLAQRFEPDSNSVSLYVVPQSRPMLRPVEQQVVLPRRQAYRKSVVF